MKRKADISASDLSPRPYKHPRTGTALTEIYRKRLGETLDEYLSRIKMTLTSTCDHSLAIAMYEHAIEEHTLNIALEIDEKRIAILRRAFSSLHLGRARNLARLGRDNEAYQAYTEAIAADDPGTTILYKIRGKFLYKNWKKANALYPIDKAVSDFQKHLDRHPQDAEAMLYCARASGYSEDQTKTLEMFNRAIFLAPSNPQTYFYRGKWYFEKTRYHMAIEDFDRAITLTPDDFRLYKSRAKCFEKKADWGNALSDYHEAITQLPKGHPGLIYLLFKKANTLLKIGHYQGTLAILDQLNQTQANGTLSADQERHLTQYDGDIEELRNEAENRTNEMVQARQERKAAALPSRLRMNKEATDSEMARY